MDTSVFPLSQHQKASSRHADCSSSFQGVYRSVVFEQPVSAVPLKVRKTVEQVNKKRKRFIDFRRSLPSAENGEK